MSKTERRRIAKAAKKAKKLAEKGGVADAPAASASRGEPNSLAQAKKAAKQGARLTHEERKHIYTERARIRREQQRARLGGAAKVDMFCFACRRRGHVVADCPARAAAGDAGGGAELDDDAALAATLRAAAPRGALDGAASKVCYRCGRDDHALRDCKKRRRKPRTPGGAEYLPFAVCFVCGGKGHLSADCPSNPNGVFPKGGACHRCGSTEHRAAACPTHPDNRCKPCGVGGGEEEEEEEEEEEDDDDVDEESDGGRDGHPFRVATAPSGGGGGDDDDLEWEQEDVADAPPKKKKRKTPGDGKPKRPSVVKF